jgi:hypothetical protein
MPVRTTHAGRLFRAAGALAVAGVAALGCGAAGSPEAPRGTSPSNPDAACCEGPPVGAVGLLLTTPGGVTLSSVSYTLTNGIDTYAGTYAVSSATTFSFVIGSVPVGSGYSLSLTATSDDGNDICSFPAPGASTVGNIAVSNRATTVVSVSMTCVDTAGLDAGSVLLTAVPSPCPLWNLILGNPAAAGDAGVVGTSNAYNPVQSIPAQVPAGQQVTLVGNGTGPDPGALAFTWSILDPDGNGEHLADAGGADASAPGATQLSGTSGTNQVAFTCPTAAAPATYTVQMVVTDGVDPDGGACDPRLATGTLQIVCEP